MAYFITLDGTEGVGKSTQKALLEQWFNRKNLPVYFTREIGGTPFGEEMRDWILHKKEEITPQSELLLIFASRHQHIEQVIKPKLKQGISVVCDRFSPSTIAYQGYGRGLSQELISHLEHFVLEDFRADISFILFAEPEICQKRLTARQKILDKMERENFEFFQRVSQGFLAQKNNQNVVAIDANGSVEETSAQIIGHLEALYGC